MCLKQSLFNATKSHNDLTSDNYTLKQEIRALKEKLETQEDSSNKQVTNIDLLKRISNLEKIVYGRNE